MAVDPQVQRLAGDIVAKCVAKGTWGGVYVPKETARAAFPREVHGIFSDALSLLEVNDFIRWHKVATCFGLNAARSKEAIDFAIRHASTRRAAVLKQRAPTRISDLGTIDAGVLYVEQQWEPEDAPWLDDLRAYPTRNEVDVRIHDLQEQVARIGARDEDALAAVRASIADLLLQVHRIASDVGKVRSLEAAVLERNAAVKRIEDDHEHWVRIIDQMHAIIKEDERIKAEREAAKVARKQTCPCGEPGKVLRPSYTAKGMRWFKDPDIALCSNHEVHSVAFQFPQTKSLVGIDRLITRMPPFTGAPFIGVGDEAHAKSIMAVLLKTGRIDEGFVDGAQVWGGPGIDG